MKIFKGVLYGLWAICAVIVTAFIVSWISNSESALAWGYFGMIAVPVTILVTVIYWLINKIFPGWKLF